MIYIKNLKLNDKNMNLLRGDCGKFVLNNANYPD
jgi:hypothetical protein